jgi:hypothetical protein
MVLKDVSADEVAVAVSPKCWNDRAMSNDGFLKAPPVLDTSGFTGCLPLKVFVNFGELPLLELFDGRFLGLVMDWAGVDLPLLVDVLQILWVMGE